MESMICACCFAMGQEGEAPRCPACNKTPACPDCQGNKVLLRHFEQADAPAWDAAPYGDFLNRFEDDLLPAYREHFENSVRRRMRTRLEVARAMIFSQAMHNYLAWELHEEGVPAADVRYAVALRQFGKIKQEKKGPKVLHLNPDAAAEDPEKPVSLGRGAWAKRSATCAQSYLKILKAPDDRAKKIADIILGKEEGTAQSIVDDAYVLERLNKVVEEKHATVKEYVEKATPLLKGEFSFLKEQADHKDARDALICEAGLLIHMTKDWEKDPEWIRVRKGAMARFEKVIDEYNDTLPFLTEFYFEDASHVFKIA